MRKLPTQTTINLDRAKGCLVGGAVGDALGYAIEFDKWPYIRERYGDKGIRRYELAYNGKALISDDTQMTLFTASGILLGMTRGYTRGVMGRLDMYCKFTYIDWLHTQEWEARRSGERCDSWLMDVPELYARRAPGLTCLSALKAVERNEEAVNDSCGCGGVMRTAPLAILDYIHGYADGEYNYCDMVAAETARITHRHPLGFIPAAVLNDILMQIFDGEYERNADLAGIVRTASERLPEIVSESDGNKTYGELWPEHVRKMQEIIEQALTLAKSDLSDVVALETIGGGWTGHEALAMAIFSAARHCNSFEDAICSSVNHSGDSDSTGAICGNIMGALLGRNAIPEHYTDDLELLDVIEEIATDLFTGCVIGYRPENKEEERRWESKYCYFVRVPRGI